MNFKNYERQYERVFTGEDLIRKKIKLEHVSVYNNIPDSVEKYQNLYRKTLSDLQKDMFDYLVKIVWLMRRFCYHDRRRMFTGGNGYVMDKAFAVFSRHYLGFNNRFFLGGYSPFNKVVTYFDNFFINFNEGNPFEEKYEYPYRYMNFECLTVVYQMPERLELLKFGEEKKMSYLEFSDYVLNYISCYNEEHGRTYNFIFSHCYMPYVKAIKEIKWMSLKNKKKTKSEIKL